jgi:outer membrane protein OmpA-like peptidoglycan-associated protein
VVASLKAHPTVRIEIRGYADSCGSEELNLKLTQQRADSVDEMQVVGYCAALRCHQCAQLGR